MIARRLRLWIGSAGALGALAVGCGESGGTAGSGPARPRTIWIGIDGATWDVIDPMLQNGELPNFQKLIERGARGSLIALPPLSSPVVWTTIATGTFPRSHEILGFTYPFGDGPGRPVSSDLRQDPALWNVASAHGRRVGVIGYFVSHPPEPVDGFVVSDRIVHGAPGATYPADLQSDAARIVDDVRRLPDLLPRFLPWDYRPEAARNPSDPYHHASQIVHRRVDDAIVRDEAFRRIALDRIDEETDLFACYFRLVDHSCHATWLYYDDTDFDEPADPAAKDLLGGIILEAYRYMDDLVGSILDAAGDDVNVVIVSDHGFGSATNDYKVRPGKGMVLSGNHRNDGIFLAAGPDIRHGTIEPLATIDVTPILATLAGLPLADDLPGRLIEDVFRPGYFDEFPLEHVPSWKIGWSAGEGAAVPLDAEREMLAELEALGYVDDFGDAPLGESSSELDFWTIAPANREMALRGELVYYAFRRDVERARALLALVADKDPATHAVLFERTRGALAAIEKSLDRAPGSLVDESVLDAIGRAD